ncbi:hypothetical protein KO566_06450 [Flavobacteriaceae bacterium XHP0103]|uniref:hypothetical protein n=1 Tax=Marixanthotalea marina TaxID=2844359 RepID=UPI002989ED71|nr:hypothetical protein [Marixanthotalea marina]MBU3821694.1 hypothetical protein [Marixanthotalea marina]
MLTDRQSLILCGFMAVGIFVGGLLDILDNFLTLTILTIIFSAILVNIFIQKKRHREEINDSDNIE